MPHLTPTTFLNAATTANVELVQSYIAQGGSPTTVDSAGNNLLGIIAANPIPDSKARAQLIKIAHLLISHDVSPTAKNQFGISAVNEAVGNGFSELCELFKRLNILLTQHITVNQFLYFNWPRHPSRQQRNDYPKTLQLLLAEKPDLSAGYQEHNFLTPLQIACKEGQTEAIKQLLLAKADPNQNCEIKQGQATPIESLCNYAYRAGTECYISINALLDAGADPNLFSNDVSRPNDSKPALIWSVISSSNNLRVIKSLLKAGALPTLKDAGGHDAYYWAKKHKRNDTLKLLMN